MKKVIFTLLSFLAIQFGYAQTTYYWVGGTTATSFTSNANWNTGPGGTGTVRTTAATNDVLVFDGLDVDDEAGQQTGPVVLSITGTIATGQVRFINNADVSFSRSSTGGTTTITLGGTGDSEPDLFVQAGSKLTLAGTTGSMAMVIGATATGRVEGELVFADNNNNTSNQNRLVSLTKGALVFATGSTTTTTTNYGYNPFGTSGSASTPAAVAGIIYEAGANYIYGGGSSPFGNNPGPLVEFRMGSNFRFRKATTGVTSMFNNRVYSNVFVENNITLTADGSVIKMDNLTVDAGSTFVTHTSGVTPINGNIVNNGTIMVPAANPSRENKIVLVGSTPQTVSGTGTNTISNLIISNVSNVSLQTTVQVDSSTIIYGSLTPAGNFLTGAGTVDSRAPFTTPATGNINVDSFLVKNMSTLTGVEIGMSVTGTNIQPNTVIANISTTNNTITLSRPVLAATTYGGAAEALTIFNGQGVLPVRFGAVSATLNNGSTNVNWKVLTETDVTEYVVERSANSTAFTQVGTVKAKGASQYNLVDASPLTGNSFYRVKAIHQDGHAVYSSVLRVANVTGSAKMTVYPNPVKGKTFNLQLSGADKEIYTMSLYNDLGQLVASRAINHQGGSANHTIELPAAVKAGMYRVTVKGSTTSLQQTLIVQ